MEHCCPIWCPLGQGGANPAAVADAMVDAVVDFVKKKQPKFVRSIKILIFQTAMMAEFHKSMKKREGEQVQEKGLLSYMKGVWLISSPPNHHLLL